MSMKTSTNKHDRKMTNAAQMMPKVSKLSRPTSATKSLKKITSGKGMRGC